MIQVFCGKRGSGKTKRLIEKANAQMETIDGHIVYIDDDNGPMHQLSRSIRFISTKEYKLRGLEGLYGYLCGILSCDYDIQQIYIDGLSNIASIDTKKAEELFDNLERLSQDFKVDFYINVNEEAISGIEEVIKKYIVA